MPGFFRSAKRSGSSPPVLPQPPVSTSSLSGEIKQHMAATDAAVDDDGSDAPMDEVSASIMFPAVDKRASVASSTSTAHVPALYGRTDEPETVSILKLGGSKPPSVASPNLRPKPLQQRSSTAISIVESEVGNRRESRGEFGLGYLFVDGKEDDRTETRTESSSAPSSGRILRTSPSKATPAARPGSRIDSVHGVLDGINMPADSGSNARIASDDDDDEQFANAETWWYFLRSLVREELRYERQHVWKLRSLDQKEDLFGRTPPQSVDVNLDDEIDPRELPIMRYLIRHFLLTLPLIRDTATNEATGLPAFWSDGLSVILERLHKADLSKSIDHGVPETASPSSRAIERFVSAGLRLSTGTASGTIYPVASSSLPPTFGVAPLSSSTDKAVESAPSPSSRKSPFKKLFGPSSPKSMPLKPVLSTSPGVAPQNETSLHRSASRQTQTTNLTSTADDQTSFVSAAEDRDNRTATDYATVDSELEHGPNEDVRFSKAADDDNETATLDGRRQVDAATPTDGHSSPASALGLPESRADQSRPYEVGVGENARHHDIATVGSEGVPAYLTAGLSPHVTSPLTGSSSQKLSSLVTRGEVSASTTSVPKSKSFSFGFLRRNSSTLTSHTPIASRTRSVGPVDTDTEVPLSRKVPSFSQPIVAMERPPHAEASRPVEVLPASPNYVAKAGVPWPFGAPVAFWRGAPFQSLKWGGFEADIVGVRNTLFSKAFIIRVRRAGRLDEYVLRTEAQFVKFFRILEKQFPIAHVRRIPLSDPNDQIVRPRSQSAVSRPDSVAARSLLDLNRVESVMQNSNVAKSGLEPSRMASALKAAAADPSVEGSPRINSRPKSPFARSIRGQSFTGEVPSVRTLSRRNTDSGLSRPLSTASISSVNLPSYLSPSISTKKMPPHDPQRRALRNWLRDTLSIRTVGHHKETAAFLLLGSIVPRTSDLKELQIRATIDEARRAARVQVAQSSAERVRVLREQWADVEQECIHGDGFVKISDALRTHPSINELPTQYSKCVEILRLDFAEYLYESFVAQPSSGARFAKFKALHAAFPYFLVKQALKIGNPNRMAKVLQDILLARPLGRKSLLQRVLATVLNDDPRQVKEQIARYRSRIGSSTLTEKIDVFVYGDPEHKKAIRRYAYEHGIELVLCILRGGEEPRVPLKEINRIVEAAKRYHAFMKNQPSQLAQARCDDPSVRLILDLKTYLSIVSKDRDSNAIRNMLGEDRVAASIEITFAPFVDLIKRTYRPGQAATALGDLQKAIDQFIIIIEALRSRIQEPQKAVRILARLIDRHQNAVYAFLHDVHRKETIVEELLQWAWTGSVFLRRGLAQTVNLDDIMPTDSKERRFLMAELSSIVKYHGKKRLRQYQNACRRTAGDLDADDPVIVQGDGQGRSQIEPHLDSKPRPPRLKEVPLYAAAFRNQLKKVFAV